MKPPALVQKAAADLCARFDANDYNPTPIVDLGALVANADGSVDSEEIDSLVQLLGPMLGAELDGELVGYLVLASLKVIEAAGTEPRVRLLADILVDCDAVEEGLIIALAVAHASNGMSSSERKLIELLGRAAHVPAGRLEALDAQVRAAYAG